MNLFSSMRSSQLFATRILILSLLSTTKIMPLILSLSPALEALDCQRSRYFDSPDMSKTSKSMPLLVNLSFLQPIVGVMPVALSSGSMILAKMVDLPALSKPINSNLADEFPINLSLYKRNNNNSMDFGDELPCGGYQDQDKKIEKEIKLISQGKECQAKECGDCECEVPAKREGVSKMCKKCPDGKAVLLHKGDPVCQACVFKNMEYKVRLLLENTFKVNKNSNILVCFSGGLNSICLAVLITNIVKRYQKNKLFNKLGFVHIQQQASLPEGFQQIFLNETGVELNVIKIEEVMREGERTLPHIKELLKQFSNSANTIDLISIFRDRLIIEYAKKHDYHFILKGLNGESLAAESFCFFAKGLGGNLPGLCSSQTVKGLFDYPLRNHLRKQLQYYFYVKRLAKLAIKTQDDNIEGFAGSQLNDQIKGFIDTLQQMYSHTAPAIVRTAQKIETNQLTHDQCKWCYLSGADSGLCRRCLRIWQGRKKTAKLDSFPLWVNPQQF